MMKSIQIFKDGNTLYIAVEGTTPSLEELLVKTIGNIQIQAISEVEAADEPAEIKAPDTSNMQELKPTSVSKTNERNEKNVEKTENADKPSPNTADKANIVNAVKAEDKPGTRNVTDLKNPANTEETNKQEAVTEKDKTKLNVNDQKGNVKTEKTREAEDNTALEKAEATDKVKAETIGEVPETKVQAGDQTVSQLKINTESAREVQPVQEVQITTKAPEQVTAQTAQAAVREETPMQQPVIKEEPVITVTSFIMESDAEGTGTGNQEENVIKTPPANQNSEPENNAEEKKIKKEEKESKEDKDEPDTPVLTIGEPEHIPENMPAIDMVLGITEDEVEEIKEEIKAKPKDITEMTDDELRMLLFKNNRARKLMVYAKTKYNVRAGVRIFVKSASRDVLLDLAKAL